MPTFPRYPPCAPLVLLEGNREAIEGSQHSTSPFLDLLKSFIHGQQTKAFCPAFRNPDPGPWQTLPRASIASSSDRSRAVCSRAFCSSRRACAVKQELSVAWPTCATWGRTFSALNLYHQRADTNICKSVSLVLRTSICWTIPSTTSSYLFRPHSPLWWNEMTQATVPFFLAAFAEST